MSEAFMHSFPTTLSPGEVCTLLASRGQRFIWRVCTGAEERHTLWDFQHSRHAAVICTSELNVQWIWPFYGPSYASLTLGASFIVLNLLTILRLNWAVCRRSRNV